MLNDIIVALSTPYGKAGIGVVRMSGKNCLNLATKMFCPLKKVDKYTPNLMVLGYIDLGETKDLGFLVYFKSPKSYTGEDTVEFQCHGGIAVTNKIIEKVVSLGARLAQPGEFSKRAFLNGKMSLDQAEGVIDTINAESDSQLRASSQLISGKLTKQIAVLQEDLSDLISEIEVSFDYPEEDIEYKTKTHIKEQIIIIKQQIEDLLSTSKKGKLIKNGVNIAIVGKTNVGKSSLLNALLGEEQAIVTDIEGTTRDIVVGSLEYKGYKFNFLDTAGLRQTNDKVESIGIEKAKQTINTSDIVLLVIDASKQLDEADKQNLSLTNNKKRIIVLNKTDLKIEAKLDEKYLTISAKNNINIEKLKEEIFNLALEGNFENDKIVLTNIRHIDLLEKCEQLIIKILDNLFDLPLDLVEVDIKDLWSLLGQITGDVNNEKIIDKIFSKFCLGK